MKRRFPPVLSVAQERMIRRLGLTPGHVETPPAFPDGRAKDQWRRTVLALFKKGLIHVQKDHALDEVFLLLSADGLRCAREAYQASKLTRQERRAHDRLTQWRDALKAKPAPVVPRLTLCTSTRAEHAAATRDGLQKARRSGVRLGRPPAVIPEEEVRRLRGQGESIRGIGRAVGLGTATVQRFLKRSPAGS